MPEPEDILKALRFIANHYKYFAVFWHVYAASAIVLLLAGVRPLKGMAGLEIAFPLLSVSFIAYLTDNPFNGTVFLLLALILLISVARDRRKRTDVSFSLNVLFGIILIAVGWIYPHFLKTDTFFLYLVASPAGLIPCPTLLLVSGFTLLFSGFAEKVWLYALSAACIFYGLIGVFYLGIYLDAVLLFAALILALNALSFLKPAETEKDSFL